MTFTERCKLATDCLPDAPYRAMLEALHREMLTEIERLHRWRSTHAPRIEALEGLLRVAQHEAHAGREAIVSLAGERAANAALTAECEASEQRATGLSKEQRGAVAYELTKRLVIDMPTARAAVDAALNWS